MYKNEQEIRDAIFKGINVDWEFISKRLKLSEDFIREFKDKLDWRNISGYQKLSEDFIREFKDVVNWYCISECQVLSEEFIREFKNKNSPKIILFNLPSHLISYICHIN